MAKLTEEILNEARSPRGGWSSRQLRLLGIGSWPPPHGWKRLVVGRDVPDSTIAVLLALRGS